MNGRPKRSVPRRDYKNLNSFGTTDSAVQFSFQENMDEDLLDLSLTPEEQDEFREEFVSSVVGPEQSSEHEREASGSKNLEVRTNKEETVDKCEDDDLELRVQLLEKKRDDLKKQQLKDRIRQLEEEVAEMSGNSKTKDTSEKKKPKKKSGGKAWCRSTLILSDSFFKYFPDLKNTEIQAFGGITSERLLWKIRHGYFNINEFCNVLIHVGTNDIFAITSNQYRFNIDLIIQEIRCVNASCRIILSSILPRPVDFRMSDRLVQDFNSQLFDFSQTGCAKVNYMPVCKSFYDRFHSPIFPLFLKTDLLHLNHAGIQKFVHFIANTLAHLN
ncbi:unnamed protein product [Mytilus edulis]|uniref:SGNH hydrolase-type esterase domain-containing protein n=1 Tax=Mytilus edulis TaxID=6550 RepID=A0A8S3U3F1_MYTED|nr:unnamed protein product [Mytilus edulis]